MPRVPTDLIDLEIDALAEHESEKPLRIGDIVALGQAIRDDPANDRPVELARRGDRYVLLRGRLRLHVAQSERHADVPARIRRKPYGTPGKRDRDDDC